MTHIAYSASTVSARDLTHVSFYPDKSRNFEEQGHVYFNENRRRRGERRQWNYEANRIDRIHVHVCTIDVYVRAANTRTRGWRITLEDTVVVIRKRRRQSRVPGPR